MQFCRLNHWNWNWKKNNLKLSNPVKHWPLCHHHVWWKRERRGLIWKIVCGPIYQMLPPPSHFEHKHKKIYFRALFLSYMGTGSFKRQKILGNQNPLCKNVFENVFQSVAILWQLFNPEPSLTLQCINTRLHLKLFL